MQEIANTFMTQATATPEVFFHVGLGKTASTYLQYAFFPKLQGIQYIQRTRYRFYKEIISKSSHHRFLLSREFDQQLEDEVKKFAPHYPQARIIILFRRHDGWAASQYRRYVKNGGIAPFSEWFDVEQDKGLWKRSDFYFMPKLAVIEKHFEHRPLVLFHEDLKKDGALFLQRMANFLGATYNKDQVSLKPVHRSYSEKQLKVIKSVGKYFFRQNRNLSENKVMNWFQRRSQLLTSYMILYPARYLPESLAPSAPLIPKAELEQVRQFYEADWEQVQAYANANNPTLAPI